MKKLLFTFLLVIISCSSPDETDEVVIGFAVDYKNETTDSVVYCLNIRGESKCDTLGVNEIRSYENVVDSIIHSENCCETIFLESFKSLNGKTQIYMQSQTISSEYNSDIGATLSLYHVVFKVDDEK